MQKLVDPPVTLNQEWFWQVKYWVCNARNSYNAQWLLPTSSSCFAQRCRCCRWIVYPQVNHHLLLFWQWNHFWCYLLGSHMSRVMLVPQFIAQPVVTHMGNSRGLRWLLGKAILEVDIIPDLFFQLLNLPESCGLSSFWVGNQHCWGYHHGKNLCLVGGA